MATQGKWLVPALALSLAVNVFIAGVVLGKRINPPRPSPGGVPAVDFNMKRFGQHLTRDERQKVRKVLRAQRGVMVERYQLVKESERRIKDLVSAPQVDREALMAAFEQHGALMQQMYSPMQQAMMEIVADLSHETRQKLADSMFKRRFPRNRQ